MCAVAIIHFPGNWELAGARRMRAFGKWRAKFDIAAESGANKSAEEEESRWLDPRVQDIGL